MGGWLGFVAAYALCDAPHRGDGVRSQHALSTVHASHIPNAALAFARARVMELMTATAATAKDEDYAHTSTTLCMGMCVSVCVCVVYTSSCVHCVCDGDKCIRMLYGVAA